MNEPFIKIHKKITEWAWYTEVNTCKLFIHLLISCNFKDGNWRNVKIKRGQTITSLNKLSVETGLSLQSVRTSLKNLESTGDLTRYQHTRYTMIQLNNYNRYNQPNTPSNTKPTRSQHEANTKLTTIEEEKEVKKEKKEEKEERRKIIPPKREWIGERIIEKEYKDIDGERFFNYWNDRDWMADHKKKNPREKVKDWQARLSTWASMSKRNIQSTTAQPKRFYTFAEKKDAGTQGYDLDCGVPFAEQEIIIGKALKRFPTLPARPKYADAVRYLKKPE